MYLLINLGNFQTLFPTNYTRKLTEVDGKNNIVYFNIKKKNYTSLEKCHIIVSLEMYVGYV